MKIFITFLQLIGISNLVKGQVNQDNLLVGIVTGIPVSRESERFSSFLRLIYEPGHRHRPAHLYSSKK